MQKNEDISVLPYEEDSISEGVEYSPNIYRKNLEATLTNTKKYCSQLEIYRLIEKGFITSPDIEIMRTLYEHGFLSRKTLTDIISYNNNILPENKRKYYKNSLKKLTKMGVLHRYSPTWSDNGESHHGPCIYSLSAGSSGYISRLYRKNTDFFKEIGKFIEKDPVKMLTSSVCGQFHASLLRNHQEYVKKAYINYSFSYKKELFYLPLAYKLQGNRTSTDMIVLCVRNNDGFDRYATHLFRTIRTVKFKENFLIENPLYVFICENSAHAKALAASFQKAGLVGLPVLYCLDRTFLNGDVLENLFTIENNDSGYEIILQKLDI